MSERIVKVCCGTGCLANGSKKVLEALRAEMEKRTIDIEVVPYVKATGCNGLCEKGPIIKIYPDDIAYYHVGLNDVQEIVEKTIVNGEAIEKLLYLDLKTKKRIRSHSEPDFIKKQTKIALRNIGEIDPHDIHDYLAVGGYQALKKVLNISGDDIISIIKKSGLRGRGGGGFPTGVKWETCQKIDRFPKYIICNGDEGDPGAFMDRSIMEGDPHSVLEGMIIASIALNSQNGYIYIRDEYGLALENMHRAIEQAKEFNYLGDNILGSEYCFDIEIVRGGGAFVCGESSALMASIEGKVGEPRAKYIRSAEYGLWGQPTVLNNVETWANVPVILEKGNEWFSKIGSPNNSGTKVFSLVGKVKNTGLVEVPMGITLQEMIFDIGGGIVGDKEFKAVQTGGPSGGCIPKELMHLPVDFDTLEAAGSMMGSGGVIVTDERTCMVEFARYYVAFLAEESCGKCVSCREGIRQILKILTDICAGKGQESDLDLLAVIFETVEKASLCGLGKSAPNPVKSTLRYFRDEYLEHIRDKRCRAGVCKDLTEFYIDESLCKGCGLCKKGCAVDAIDGSKKQPHSINQSKCIKCGNCIDICKFKAVKVR
ncbi:MAG TPA: NADH-ubiquinone oxidoreductase-F iron-sulfur binding region domain-containing protein [Desulfosporosinus sp.]|nr:NADH-ubiquinone oxidoreductase-F iron-sulfur binding region domain-containing protein [Desulfosporosinus sp.]